MSGPQHQQQNRLRRRLRSWLNGSLFELQNLRRRAVVSVGLVFFACILFSLASLYGMKNLLIYPGHGSNNYHDYAYQTVDRRKQQNSDQADNSNKKEMNETTLEFATNLVQVMGETAKRAMEMVKENMEEGKFFPRTPPGNRSKIMANQRPQQKQQQQQQRNQTAKRKGRPRKVISPEPHKICLGSNETIDTEQGILSTPSNPSLYAYAFVIGGCDPDRPSYRNYIHNVLVATHILRQKGSRSDVHLFIQMACRSPHTQLVAEEVRWLHAMDISIRYLPKHRDESFYKIMLEKFQILRLTQYRRVFFLDADVMPLINLDYLMELSDQGVLEENVLVPGPTSPGNGGFFVLKPFPGAMDRVRQIIEKKDRRIALLPFPHWDERLGWGHQIIPPDHWENRLGQTGHRWKFYGVYADQGLLFHWAKYVRKSVTIIFPKGRIENWGTAKTNPRIVILKQNLTADRAFKNYPEVGSVCLVDECEGPVIDDHVHFVGKKKPWLVPPPQNITTISEAPGRGSPIAHWYWQLRQVNDKLRMGLDLTTWTVGQAPLLGFSSVPNMVKSSLRASNITIGRKQPQMNPDEEKAWEEVKSKFMARQQEKKSRKSSQRQIQPPPVRGKSASAGVPQRANRRLEAAITYAMWLDQKASFTPTMSASLDAE